MSDDDFDDKRAEDTALAESNTFSEKEFQELLANESFVNIERLREAARHGVPSSVRGQVWKILIGVSKPDRSEEVSIGRKMHQEFLTLSAEAFTHLDPGVAHNVRIAIKQFQYSRNMPFFRDKDVQSMMEEVIVTYLANHTSARFFSGMVDLLAPFAFSQRDRADLYYSYCNLLEYLDFHIGGKQLGEVLARFLMQFRKYQSELCNYFEDEELSPNEWALEWIRRMLSRSLPFECVLRLWDTYLSSDEGFDLHIYVCLAILLNCKEDLMELEYSELKWFLTHLPQLDMDQIIQHAYNMYNGELAQNLI